MARKRDTSKKRESILDAAVEAFQNEGYENTSMDRIAEIASASKRTVYNHFSSKEILFLAVVDRFISEICSLKDIQYNSERSVKEQLGDFADTKIAVVKNPSWMGLMKVTLGVFIREPELAKVMMERSEEGSQSLIKWLEEAKEDGKIQVENCELAANIFWSIISGALFWPQVFGPPMDEATTELLKSELIDTFLSRYGM